MEKLSNVRKNVYKKGSGFSKYNQDGQVVYSESVGGKGEKVRHFYKYDEFQRRNYYYRETCDSSFEEITIYSDNGGKIIQTHHCPALLTCIRVYNKNGRLLEEHIKDDKTGQVIHKNYNTYTDRYDISEANTLFTYNG